MKIDISDVVPFIMVTHFNPTLARTLPAITMDRLPKTWNPLLPSQRNCLLSIRVEGFSIVFKRKNDFVQRRVSHSMLSERQVGV